MGWSKISFAEGFDSAECRWFRTTFQQLYEHASDEDYHTLALYLDLRPSKGTTLILSPAGTAQLQAALTSLDLIECERPAANDVAVVVGQPIANNPASSRNALDEADGTAQRGQARVTRGHRLL